MTFLLFLVGCGVPVACPGDEFCEEAERADVDNDGYANRFYEDSDADDLDCDDGDATAYPGAPLVCPPGDTPIFIFDRNCNGLPDRDECRADTGR